MGIRHHNEFRSDFSFFRTLFRGNFPLAITYWLYFFIPISILRAMVVFAELRYMPYIVVALLTIISSLFMLLMSKCIYSSASKYHGAVIWKYLAMLASFLMVVGAIRDFIVVFDNFNQISVAKRDLNNEKISYPKKINNQTTLNNADFDGMKYIYKFSYRKIF